jgi:hypothetical protein
MLRQFLNRLTRKYFWFDSWGAALCLFLWPAWAPACVRKPSNAPDNVLCICKAFACRSLHLFKIYNALSSCIYTYLLCRTAHSAKLGGSIEWKVLSVGSSLCAICPLLSQESEYYKCKNGCRLVSRCQSVHSSSTNKMKSMSAVVALNIGYLYLFVLCCHAAGLKHTN